MPVTDKPKHTLSLSALSLSLSFCFYLVEINDWLLAYELILDLLIVVSLIATIGLFSISIIKVIETKKENFYKTLEGTMKEVQTMAADEQTKKLMNKKIKQYLDAKFLFDVN